MTAPAAPRTAQASRPTAAKGSPKAPKTPPEAPPRAPPKAPRHNVIHVDDDKKPRYSNRGRTVQVLSAFSRFLLGFLLEELVWRLPLVAWALGGRSTRRNPERLRELLEGLGGAFIKFGQLFSMRSDILPPVYCAALANLFDNVPPFPSSEARAIIERELGRPLEDIFDHFDDNPIGAASFGQVHLATLKPESEGDEGRKAAVKVCRPGSQETIEIDGRLLLLLGMIVDALGILGRITLAPVFKDFVRWTRREINYLQEGKNADHLHELTSWNPRQRIPYIYWDKSTPRVLTMEFLEGITVNEIIRRHEAGDPDLDGELAELGCDRVTIARNVWQTFLLQAFVGQTFHGDPHPGNLIVLPENVVGFIDFGLQGRLNEESRREQGIMLDAVARENIEKLFTATLDVLDAPRGLLVTDTYDEFAENADAWLDACDNPGAPMVEKTLNRLVTSSMKIARQVGLVLAPHTMLFYKGLITIDAVILRVNPEFDYKKETRRALRLIRMRELDRLYAPGNVLDTALLTQLLLTSLPDFAASRLQDFEQGQRLIYRKLNLLPVIVGGMFTLASWGSLALGLALIGHRFHHLGRLWALPGTAVVQHLFDLLQPYILVFFVATVGLRWGAAFFKNRSFVKAQREELTRSEQRVDKRGHVREPRGRHQQHPRQQQHKQQGQQRDAVAPEEMPQQAAQRHQPVLEARDHDALFWFGPRSSPLMAADSTPRRTTRPPARRASAGRLRRWLALALAGFGAGWLWR